MELFKKNFCKKCSVFRKIAFINLKYNKWTWFEEEFWRSEDVQGRISKTLQGGGFDYFIKKKLKYFVTK